MTVAPWRSPGRTGPRGREVATVRAGCERDWGGQGGGNGGGGVGGGGGRDLIS